MANQEYIKQASSNYIRVWDAGIFYLVFLTSLNFFKSDTVSDGSWPLSHRFSLRSWNKRNVAFGKKKNGKKSILWGLILPINPWEIYFQSYFSNKIVALSYLYHTMVKSLNSFTCVIHNSQFSIHLIYYWYHFVIFLKIDGIF